MIITLLDVFSSRSLLKQQTSSGETELVQDFDVHMSQLHSVCSTRGPGGRGLTYQSHLL